MKYYDAFYNENNNNNHNDNFSGSDYRFDKNINKI